jgi:hypothetical protein
MDLVGVVGFTGSGETCQTHESRWSLGRWWNDGSHSHVISALDKANAEQGSSDDSDSDSTTILYSHDTVYNFLRWMVWPLPFSQVRSGDGLCCDGRRTNCRRSESACGGVAWFVAMTLLYLAFLVSQIFAIGYAIYAQAFALMPTHIALLLRALSCIPMCLSIRRSLRSGSQADLSLSLTLQGQSKSKVSLCFSKIRIFMIISVVVYIPIICLTAVAQRLLEVNHNQTVTSDSLQIGWANCAFYPGGCCLLAPIIFFLMCDISCCDRIIRKLLKRAQSEELTFQEYQIAAETLDKVSGANHWSMGLFMATAVINVVALAIILYMYPERALLFGSETVAILTLTVDFLMLSTEVVVLLFLVPDIAHVNEIAMSLSKLLAKGGPWKLKSADEHRINIFLSYVDCPFGYKVWGARLTKLNVNLQFFAVIITIICGFIRMIIVRSVGTKGV